MGRDHSQVSEERGAVRELLGQKIESIGQRAHRSAHAGETLAAKVDDVRSTIAGAGGTIGDRMGEVKASIGDAGGAMNVGAAALGSTIGDAGEALAEAIGERIEGARGAVEDAGERLGAVASPHGQNPSGAQRGRRAAAAAALVLAGALLALFVVRARRSAERREEDDAPASA